MPAQTSFFGCQRELALLHQWIVAEHSRAVVISGMVEQGKTALAPVMEGR